MELFKRLFGEEVGVTLIEYALLAGLIAMVAVVALGTAGDALKTFYNSLATEIRDSYSSN